MDAQMNEWLWLALIPTLVFAGAHPYNMRKDPVYIDVHPGKIIVMAENIEIAESELTVPRNNFERLLEQVAIVRDLRYVLLILRPGSEILQRQLRQIIREYDVDIGFDVWEAGREFSAKEQMGIYETGTADPPKPDPFEHIRPYHVTVKDDRLILDKDNITVMREDLKTPGNPFESFVDQCEANGGNPYIVFDPTMIPIGPDLLKVIHERAPLMISNYCAMNSTTLSPTPMEAQTDGKQPVIFECRSNQLFFISPDVHQQAKPNAEGYYIDSPTEETDEKWFGLQLAELNLNTQYIAFYVHPDSFDIFRRARKVLWDRKIPSTLQLMNESFPLSIGADGHLLVSERPSKHNEDFEQSGPAYPPQGVGSADP